MRGCVALALVLGGLSLGALTAGPAFAANECDGLRVCLPVAGPWVVVSSDAVDYELACPLPGYVIGGTDARVAASDVDVSFRGELGSPVGPGVTTLRSAVFGAVRARAKAGTTSFQPFLGCIPTSGGGGRALTGVAARAAGSKPIRPIRSVVVNAPVRSPSVTVRVTCPAGSRLVGSTLATAFRQPLPPSTAQAGAVRVRRAVVDGVIVARVTASPAAGSRAEVQVRALCSRLQ